MPKISVRANLWSVIVNFMAMFYSFRKGEIP
jgi:hypothetical protein